MTSTFDASSGIVSTGVSIFADALDNQAVDVTRVDWRPPMEGTEADLATVAMDPLRVEANEKALAAYLGVQGNLVDVAPASEVLGLQKGEFLHAGPPLLWENASGPMRGALLGAAAFEGLVDDPEDAEALFASGSNVTLEPCHHRSAVGPMAGVVSPSMWMWVIEDPTDGRRTYCSLNEGLGKVLRYGAYSSEVLERLRWMSDVLGPALAAATRGSDPINVTSILGQMLQMGDEAHNRNRAGTLWCCVILRRRSCNPDSIPRMSRVFSFIGNDHFFLNLAMPACKLALDAARNISRRWWSRWRGTEPSSVSRPPARGTSGSPAAQIAEDSSGGLRAEDANRTSAIRRSPRPRESAGSRWRPRRRSCASSAEPFPTRSRPPGG